MNRPTYAPVLGSLLLSSAYRASKLKQNGRNVYLAIHIHLTQKATQ